MALSPRLRWRLDRIREQLSGLFGGSNEPRRPQLCPACGTLVGATATRCHQCGASLTFSIAAASKSLERWLPATSPATYSILAFSCLLYGVSLLATIRETGLQPPPGGGMFALFGIGGINGDVLQRLGASLPLIPFNLAQPWRFVMAVFLHGSLMHIIFNMWVLMDIGPQLEEQFGSARFFFIYVSTGVGGYLLSSFFGHFAVGGSGAILGLCGVIIAITAGSRSASAQMLRGQVIRLLIYIAVIAILPIGGFLGRIDNFAHVGGFASGFLMGKIMTDRPPVSPEERKRAQMIGWATALVVVASIAMVVRGLFHAG